MPPATSSETSFRDDFTVTARGSLFAAVAVVPFVLISVPPETAGGTVWGAALSLVGAAAYGSAMSYRRIRHH
ncbi:hypothetical protein ACM614_11635 [Streptomyces sp. 12297]